MRCMSTKLISIAGGRFGVVCLLDQDHQGDHKFPDTEPIPMILFCPNGHRHVDAGKFAAKPHHTHACQECGIVWRPAIENTVGVQFLPGFKDAT